MHIYMLFIFPAYGVSKMLDEKMYLFSCVFAFFFFNGLHKSRELLGPLVSFNRSMFSLGFPHS